MAFLKHPVLNQSSSKEKVIDYLNSKATEDEFINFFSGKYKANPNAEPSDVARDVLPNHPFNNPDICKKIAINLDKELMDYVKNDPDAKKSWEDGDDLRLYSMDNSTLGGCGISDIISNLDFDKETAEHLFSKSPILRTNKENNLTQGLVHNKYLDKQTVHSLIDMGANPIHMASEHVTPEHIRNHLDDAKDMSGSDYSNALDKLGDHVKDDDLADMATFHAKRNLRDKDFEDHDNTLDKILGKMSPDYRRDYISESLGMTGGKHNYDIDEVDSPEDFHYDNWINGNKYRHAIEKEVAKSKYLDPEHVEHIKRHGTHNAKMGLFWNDDVPLEHKIEMHGKWANDDSKHGYDSDHYKDSVYDHKIANNYDDYYEEAREKAYERYPRSEWEADTGTTDDDYAGTSLEDHINDGLDNYDWRNHDTGQLSLDGSTVYENYENDKESHPEYQNIIKELTNSWNDKVKEGREDHDSDLNQRYEDALSETEHEIVDELKDRDKEKALYLDQTLPNGLTDRIPSVGDFRYSARLDKWNKAKSEKESHEAKRDHILNAAIPNRKKEHYYAPGQHLAELAKEYADVNGGVIGMDTLNKKHPNLVSKFKEIFGNKPKLTSEEIQQKIDAMPKRKYDISYSGWDKDNMQNLNGQNEAIFRLDHPTELIDQLKQKDPELAKTFLKLQESADHSPSHPNSIDNVAWSRVDMTNPKHPIVDEVQSDIEKALRIAATDEKSDNITKAHAKELQNHIAGWREALYNFVIKTAKEHGAEKISTHSPESKANQVSANTVHSVYKEGYEKVPRSMGFKVDSHANLPLTNQGKQALTQDANIADIDDYINGIQEHAQAHQLNLRLAALSAHKNPGLNAQYLDVANEHKNKALAHQSKVKQMDPLHQAGKININTYVPDEENLPEDPDSTTPNTDWYIAPEFEEMGHDHLLSKDPTAIMQPLTAHTLDLRPEAFKKHYVEIDNLLKAEASPEMAQKVDQIMQLLSSDQAQQVFQALQQQKPQVYEALMGLLQLLGSSVPEEETIQEQQQADQKDDQPSTAIEMAADGVPMSRKTKDEPITRRRELYSPGAIREYNDHSVRQKQDDGSWAAMPNIQEATPGQEGQSGEQQ